MLYAASFERNNRRVRRIRRGGVRYTYFHVQSTSRDEGEKEKQRKKDGKRGICTLLPSESSLSFFLLFSRRIDEPRLRWGKLGGRNAASVDGRTPGGGPSSPSLPWRWLPLPSRRFAVVHCTECACRSVLVLVSTATPFTCTLCSTYLGSYLCSSWFPKGRLVERGRVLELRRSPPRPRLNIPGDDCD
ncbi:hypothetical protein LX32DRAFT_311889 [Colletotrichum zoysiae]|uniref:Uncharacterized protein n=1 Tax=Colletotrichum zoysiae TaxID=1216348 RepID=A0AAD9LW52_9PEZI|nr:hypothetical protein LX32DRAFT_311889 [Colletotrichum zoysiae]